MNFLIDFLKEIVFLFLYFTSALLGYIFPLTNINNKSSKNVIVFIRGGLTQNPIYFFLKRYLEKKGYSVYMTNFGLELYDLNKSAQILANYIEKNRLKNVVLVGTSIGGIIGFHYVQKLEGWKKVKKLIAIGAPFKGTLFVSLLVFFLKAGRQIFPNSQYQKDLFAEKIKNINKIVCISAKYDEIIPNESSKIPGAKIEELKIAGHVNLLAFSSQTYRLIVKHS